MTQHKNRKAAIRARMAVTGESYTEAARHRHEQPDPLLPLVRTGFAAALQEFGIPEDVLSLALRYCAETDAYPALSEATTNRLAVYLDRKHWIALSKARLGQAQFEHDQHAYELLRAVTMSGEVVVPLSATTYMETGGNPRQNEAIANVMAEISGFVTITGQAVAVEHQLQTALAARFEGRSPAPLRPFGLGVAFAFGDQRRLVLRRLDGTAPDMPARQVRDMEMSARVIGEYMMLRGPRPDEVRELRALGYRPEEFARIEEQRLKRERELAAMLSDGTSDRNRLADIVNARYLYWELGEHLRTALQPFSLDIETFFAYGKDWLTALLQDIPHAAVTTTLSEKGFRDSYKKWKGNDLRDGDTMAAAIPYCDVVMTDNYVAAQLRRSPAVTRQGTLVLSRLSDLNDALPGIIADRRAAMR